MARHDLDKLMVAAALRGHGKSWKHIGEALDVNERTARRWNELPEFRTEVERVRSSLTPTPRGVFIAALLARKDDGVDWQARLRAADALMGMDASPEATQEDDLITEWA